MRKFTLVALVALWAGGADAQPVAPARYEVTIRRDDWGIAHVRGRTDADAVYGMMFAQAEDDFPRVERNLAEALGRMAAADGEAAVWSDLRARLYSGEDVLRARYAGAPPWMRTLCEAWAAGLNAWAATHAARYIARFEPWMALSFSEGSIGGDIEDIDLDQLRAFYGRPDEAAGPRLALARRRALEHQGSNGIAVAPKLTQGGHPLLLINPHTSFYFRSEAKVESGEGLNVYGASTWGQFFVYQGFNATAGWMHTSSGIVRTVAYDERIARKGTRWLYRHGKALRPVTERVVSVPYRAADGRPAERVFTVFATHHGPVVARTGTGWRSFAMMDRPVDALAQSFLRTKARDHAAFEAVADRYKANTSNNTLFADGAGTIAFELPHYVQARSARADWSRPVSGADRANDLGAPLPLAAIPRLVNPASGWLYNSNDAPWSAGGAGSIDQARYPAFMDAAGPSARGLHAVALLSGARGLTAAGLRDLAYDPAQPGFDRLLPPLFAAWDALPTGREKRRLAGPVALLRDWDRRWAAGSRAQTMAHFYARAMLGGAARPSNAAVLDGGRALAPAARLAALGQAVEVLERDFGSWRVPWGKVNCLQRPATGGYDDRAPCEPVGFATERWGSLAAFEARARPGLKRLYGDTGNSFVAVVEFGPRVRAMAVMTGGQSGDPKSKHWFDQGAPYAAGRLRPVYFHEDELAGHVRRTYRPG